MAEKTKEMWKTKCVYKIVDYFISILLSWKVEINVFEQKGMEARIFELVNDYFNNIPSPHGLLTEEENYAADIVDILENYLDMIDLTIPDEDREGCSYEARLYGMTYAEISGKVANILFEEKKQIQEIIRIL